MFATFDQLEGEESGCEFAFLKT